MTIALIGDVHGKVFHLLALLAELQKTMDSSIDMFFQLGDLGAFPERFTDETMERLQNDVTELQFYELMRADSQTLQKVGRIKEYLGGPIYTIRGNHEDYSYLEKMSSQGTDTFHLIPQVFSAWQRTAPFSISVAFQQVY